MNNINYVVASGPRCATRYMATILNDLGLNCGHENYFGFADWPKFRSLMRANLDFFGDSSWLSVPYLHKLPENCLILHQVRDPLKTLNSCLSANGGRFFSMPPRGPYHEFAFNNVDTSKWPKEKSTQLAKIREQLWWSEWMEKIESASPVLRYRIEDVDKDFLLNLIERFNPPQYRKEHALRNLDKVLENVSKTTNNRGDPGKLLKHDELLPEVIELARKYGYDY